MGLGIRSFALHVSQRLPPSTRSLKPGTLFYAFAPWCFSTVLHDLSSAWQIFSKAQSTHFGDRAKHRRRPCQMIWWENRIHFSLGITRIRSCSMFLGSSFFV